MTDIPMLFSAPMILALLREANEPGTGKTETRRELKSTPGHHVVPKVKIGDRLWVKETHWRYGRWSGRKEAGKVHYTFKAADNDVLYSADASCDLALVGATKGKFGQSSPAWHQRPAIFMERRNTRLTLVVADVKVERLLDITEESAKREGVGKEFRTVIARPDGGPDYHIPNSHRGGFMNIWARINGPKSLDANPWVAAIRFVPHLCNIDKLAA